MQTEVARNKLDFGIVEPDCRPRRTFLHLSYSTTLSRLLDTMPERTNGLVSIGVRCEPSHYLLSCEYPLAGGDDAGTAHRDQGPRLR